jgi:hypothetical protein
MGAVGAHWASLRGVFAQPSWVSILLQAFTIIGGGRVGQALVDMGDGKDVSATSNICSVLLTVPCPCSGAQQHGTGPPSLSLTPPPPLHCAGAGQARRQDRGPPRPHHRGHAQRLPGRHRGSHARRSATRWAAGPSLGRHAMCHCQASERWFTPPRGGVEEMGCSNGGRAGGNPSSGCRPLRPLLLQTWCSFRTGCCSPGWTRKAWARTRRQAPTQAGGTCGAADLPY